MSWIASQTYVLQHILLSITIIIITRKQELYAGGGDPVAAAAAGAQGQRDPQAGEGATQTQGRCIGRKYLYIYTKKYLNVI